MIAVAPPIDRPVSSKRHSLRPAANYSWCNLVAQAELINQFSILSSDGSKLSWLERSRGVRLPFVAIIFIRSLPCQSSPRHLLA